jgi:hypothetical protein
VTTPSPSPRNPYRPGVGKPPPYLADRDQQLRRFGRYLEDFPENATNVRVTGLRGVGKTVLLKEYRKAARARDWVVIQRDLSPRLVAESDFALAVAADLQKATEAFSAAAKIKRLVGQARTAIGDITVGIPGGPSVTVGPGGSAPSAILEDRVKNALHRVGELAENVGRGVVFLYDEAHVVYDRPRKHEFPLSTLVGAFVQVQDDADHELPVMLVVCGLPPLVNNLQSARSHSERFFKAEELGFLALDPEPNESVSPATLALTKPAAKTGLAYNPSTAERIVKDVAGYPYFIQLFGAALWDAAMDSSQTTIDDSLYDSVHRFIQRDLDSEFFEGRYNDATRADKLTLRIAGSLGDENFQFSELAAAITSRNSNATQQSVNRLLIGNLIYRVSHGEYAYTAPLFGDFLRRKYPREDDDT